MKFVNIGERVRRGEPILKRGDWSDYLRIGDEGEVIELHPPIPEIPCPCGGSENCDYCAGTGILPKIDAWAVVRWTLKNGSTVKTAIHVESEGRNWERIK